MFGIIEVTANWWWGTGASCTAPTGIPSLGFNEPESVHTLSAYHLVLAVKTQASVGASALGGYLTFSNCQTGPSETGLQIPPTH